MVRYGFLDESGDTSYATGSSGNLVVVVIVVGNPERLRKAVTKTRKALNKQIRDIPELKAAWNNSRIVNKLLTSAVNIGFDAVAVVADKRQIYLKADPEELYRTLCARAVREVLERFGSFSLTLDRRYTDRKQQRRLTEVLMASVGNMAGVALAIDYENSEKEKCLQVADAIAWTVFQKHERGDDTLWQAIQGRVIEVKL